MGYVAAIGLPCRSGNLFVAVRGRSAVGYIERLDGPVGEARNQHSSVRSHRVDHTAVQTAHCGVADEHQVAPGLNLESPDRVGSVKLAYKYPPTASRPMPLLNPVSVVDPKATSPTVWLLKM